MKFITIFFNLQITINNFILIVLIILASEIFIYLYYLCLILCYINVPSV